MQDGKENLYSVSMEMTLNEHNFLFKTECVCVIGWGVWAFQKGRCCSHPLTASDFCCRHVVVL